MTDETQLEQRIQTICLLILTTVAVATALLWLRPVMIPFVLAVFFTLGLSPLVDLQTRRLRFPRWLAVLVTLILALALLVGIGVLVTTSATRLAANAGAYREQLAELVARASRTLPLERLGIDPRTYTETLLDVPVETVTGMLVSTTNAIIDIASKGFLMLIYVVFLLVGGAVGESRVGGTWSEVESRIKGYIVVKTLLSAATGVAVGVVLAMLGVDLAMVFGLMAFLLNFIPSIGSVIATLLPLPVVVVSPEISATAATLAIVIPGAIQFTIGNVLEPKLMGDELDLHPVTILLALVLWGMLWGVVGMLLAAPITAMMKILFERLELTAPIADLLAGRVDRLRNA